MCRKLPDFNSLMNPRLSGAQAFALTRPRVSGEKAVVVAAVAVVAVAVAAVLVVCKQAIFWARRRVFPP